MLSTLESNALQRKLIQSYCKTEGLDRKPGALKWCTDGHAEQCRELINLGVGKDYISNSFIEVMISNKATVRELIDLSFTPWNIYVAMNKRFFG